jgi:hypothetical protein
MGANLSTWGAKKRRGIAANRKELDATIELVMLLILIFTRRMKKDRKANQGFQNCYPNSY